MPAKPILNVLKNYEKFNLWNMGNDIAGSSANGAGSGIACD